MNGKNSVRGATGLLIITLTLSNILGLVRDRLLAAKIPAEQLDIYYAAFRLPDLVTNLIVVGAIAVAFLPLFTHLRSKDEKQAWEAASAILNLMVYALIVSSLVLWLAMPWLMPLVVPDFSGDKLTQVITLARWLTLTPILFGMSYLLSGVLQSYQRFAVYSLAPLVYNGSIILGTALFADQFGVIAPVSGVLMGAFLHMAIQLPVAFRLGWTWQPIFSLQHPAIKKITGLMVPRMVGLFAMQFTTIIATAIASGWPGAITYYNLATNIQTMPTAVFANSIATALFPALSLSAATKADGEFRERVVAGVRWIVYLLVPAAVGIILLRIQIVRLVLGAGFFGWEATTTTADVLGWFAISLVASGLVPLLARAFYAREDMRTPMSIALVAALVTIGLSYYFSAVLPETVTLRPDLVIHVGGVAALAIAFSIGSFIQAALLLAAVWRQLAFRVLPSMRVWAQVALATLLMAIVVQATKTLTGQYLDLTYAINILAQTVLAVVLGGLTYVATTALLGGKEWHEIREVLVKKFSSTTT